MGDAREPGRVVNPAMFGFDSAVFLPEGGQKSGQNTDILLIVFQCGNARL